MKDFAFALLITAIVFVGCAVFIANQPSFGGAGNDNSIQVGQGVMATTSQGAVTYTATQIASNRYIQHVASAALTATLPTKASLNAAGFLKNPGEVFTLFIYASTTKITLAGNTGVNLETASTTKDISAAGIGRIDFIRQTGAENGNIDAFLTTAQ